MSTLFVNNLNTASGSTITIPTGKQLIGTDTNSIKAPGMVVQVATDHDTTTLTMSSDQSYHDTGLSITFTPKYYTSNIKKKNIAYNKYGSFFIDLSEKNIFITDYLGSIHLSSIDNLLDKDKKLESKLLKHNLSDVDRVYDSLIYENNLYLAYVKKTRECKKIVISFANLNNEKLNFANFFISECSKVAPGRMAVFSKNNEKGILLSVSSGSYNDPSLDAQNDNSINGKTIFINFLDKKYSVFTKGHRVVQGLFVDDEYVIATEHGPRGGDEINILKSKHNYGWPISSYGEKYDFKYEAKPHFKKTHFEHGFEEPIFTFAPASILKGPVVTTNAV